MKTTPLIFTALMLSITLSAQLNKGGMMIAGNFNYFKSHSASSDTNNFSTNNKGDNKSFTSTIRFGYLATSKIMVGVYGSFNNNSQNNTIIYQNGNPLNTSVNEQTQSQNIFSGGVFARYYEFIGKSKFAIFGQLTAGYGLGKQELTQSWNYTGNTTINKSYSDLSTLNIGFNPGLVFFVTKNIAIETSLGYLGFNVQKNKNNYNNGTQTNEVKNTSFNSNLNLSLSNLSWGINFYFGGGKNKAGSAN